VVFEDGDVFGNGVNIASRIESLGVAGSILMSKNVRNQLTNKSEFQLASLGSFEFKNVSEPMEVFALANPGFVVPKPEDMKGKLKQIEKKSGALKWISAAVLVTVSAFAIWFFTRQNKIVQPVIQNSIAVLPFVNMSNDADQEYFSDGISEEIINKLAQIHALKVTGRTSSFSFRGKDLDLQEIGKKLNVSHILEGSVRKSGNTLRITAQLIKVEDGFHLYSKNFDREIEDIFTIQDEISLSILDAIKLEILGEEREAVLKKYTDNVEAYQLYLNGRFHMNKFTPDDLFKAIEFFDAAIAIDSTHAIAYADKAFCYMNLRDIFGVLYDESMPLARDAAQRSLKLDDQIAESHLAMGRIKLHFDWNIEDALLDYNKAIAINPNSAEIHTQLGFAHILLGNHQEAIEHANQALSLDPFSMLNLWYNAATLHYCGDAENVMSIGKRMKAMDPDLPWGYLWTAIAHLALGDFEAAIADLNLPVNSNNADATTVLGMIYGIIGEQQKAQEMMQKVRNDPIIHPDKKSMNVGKIYALMGELDSAFYYLDKAIQGRDNRSIWLKLENESNPVSKNDPRVKEFLKNHGLPY
jgi:TolB-like protein/Flp pilus assembly protein TadD